MQNSQYYAMISLTNSDKGSITMKFSTRDRYALRLMVELANPMI